MENIPDWMQDHPTAGEKTYGQKRVEALPAEQRRQVEALGSSLEASLAQYLLRPDADPKVLEGVQNFIAQLSHALMYGDSTKPLGATRTEDVTASLTGASTVLDISRDVRAPDIEPRSEEAKQLEHFLTLVQKRVERSLKS